MKVAVMDRPQARYYRQLGRHIREARHARGWTKLRLAMELNYDSEQAVYYWEIGRNRVSAYVLHRLDAIFEAGWR